MSIQKRNEPDWNIKVRLHNHIKSRKHHGELLPSNNRFLIVGPSNCGKTALMIDNFVYAPGWLNFETFYICSKSLNQPKYITLKQDMDFELEKFNESIAYFFSTNEEMVAVDECDDLFLISYLKIKIK